MNLNTTVLFICLLGFLVYNNKLSNNSLYKLLLLFGIYQGYKVYRNGTSRIDKLVNNIYEEETI